MAAELVMPQLGLTMTEGKVLRWYKQAGETFAAGEPLFEVETDKVNMDVEATEPGRLVEILAPLNETLAVRTVLARYEKEGAPALATGARLPVSPRARKLAAELGVDLARLSGSGPGGRIVEQDVRRAAPAAPPAETPSRLRSATAERMTRSFQSAPHFYLTREVDASELLLLKNMLSAAAARRGAGRISITDLLLKALALSVVEHPAVRASWVEGRIRRHERILLGVAVAQDAGLIVPAIQGADALPILELARERQALVERVRSGHLRTQDFGETCATLSNLGMYGVDQFQAILNSPESLILGAGRIRERVCAVHGAAAVRPTLHCSISVDHRVLDGAQAARFLGTLADMLENPGALLA
ncbi:MAG TPA: dihydrolipoamide acetyltransferase family protein [Bryobacteraceae bacterium]|nr:dihydrolipoamide acetyltransferase family protein [Bryobacteraceae bacterium]